MTELVFTKYDGCFNFTGSLSSWFFAATADVFCRCVACRPKNTIFTVHAMCRTYQWFIFFLGRFPVVPEKLCSKPMKPIDEDHLKSLPSQQNRWGQPADHFWIQIHVSRCRWTPPRFFYRIWTNDLGLCSRLSAETFPAPASNFLKPAGPKNRHHSQTRCHFAHTTHAF